MSAVITISFPATESARRAFKEIRGLEGRNLCVLEDMCYVERLDNGSIKIHQVYDFPLPAMALGAAAGALCGLMTGLYIGFPITGIVLGVLLGLGAGLLVGELSDIGINDDYIEKMATHVRPDCSVLFLMVRRAEINSILKVIARYDGDILHTTMDHKQADHLRSRLAGLKNPDHQDAQEAAGQDGADKDGGESETTGPQRPATQGRREQEESERSITYEAHKQPVLKDTPEDGSSR